MSFPPLEVMFTRMGNAELPLCVALNRFSLRVGMRRFFLVVSRLGDGPFWYALIAAWPVIDGMAGVRPALHMALSALVGVSIYRWLKGRLTRPRPFVAHGEVTCRAVPLDRFSFPSGHTLHAMLFTVVALHYDPRLVGLLVPFTALVMASRVVLGMHYPTDVLAGAVLGAVLGWGSLWIGALF